MKVRILDPGFIGFTGVFGRHTFTDGISNDISEADAEWLGACVAVEIVGGENDGKNPSVTQQMVDKRNMEMEGVMTTSPADEAAAREAAERAQKAQAAAEVLKKIADKQAGKTGNGGEAPKVLTYDYTKEDLAALVSKGGIAHLRAFTEQYGVKGTSVKKIVDAMLELKSQNAPVAQPAAPTVEEAKPGEDNDVVTTEGAPVVPAAPEAGDDDVVDTAAPEAPVADAPAATDLDLDLDAELAALEADKE